VTPERLDYSPPPVARPLGWRWAAPLAMNCIAAGMGVGLAWVWPSTDLRFDPLAWTVFGGPVMLLQVVLLRFALAMTVDTHQPTWNPFIRYAVLWTAPLGLVVSIVVLLLDVVR